MVACKIYGYELSEISDNWKNQLFLSDSKLHQFYIVTETLQEFHFWCDYFDGRLELRPAGNLGIPNGSISVAKNLETAVEKALGVLARYSYRVNIFCEKLQDSLSNLSGEGRSYKISRFGHDYNQIPVESIELKKAFENFSGEKVVVFTWIDSSNKDCLHTAIGSDFKDGIFEPSYTEE